MSAQRRPMPAATLEQKGLNVPVRLSMERDAQRALKQCRVEDLWRSDRESVQVGVVMHRVQGDLACWPGAHCFKEGVPLHS